MIVKLATSVWHTSTAPRDAAMINPVINSTVAGNDWTGLANDWLTRFQAWSGIGTTSQIQCKVYDATVVGTKSNPNYPLATVVRNVGVAANVGSPREIAVCLSFYADVNAKRHRGRLYVPFYWLFPASALADRPSATVRQKVGELADVLGAVGAVDDDWSVWSKVDHVARKVTHWWVDDEWDTQRRRGLRPTTRNQGTTSE
jgi:hypothetical protein